MDGHEYDGSAHALAERLRRGEKLQVDELLKLMEALIARRRTTAPPANS